MNYIFEEIECLTEESKKKQVEILNKKYFGKGESRYLDKFARKFINYNRNAFDFLHVEPILIDINSTLYIYYKSSKYIGGVPLFSPVNGTQIGDFIVSPRYKSKDKYLEYFKIIDLIDEDLKFEIYNGLPLISNRIFKPPLYIEAVEFIKLLNKLVKYKWQKFSVKEKILDSPNGRVNWNKYINNEYKVENRLKYPVRKNVLSQNHLEFQQLKYVYNICKKEILSNTTPFDVKQKYNKALKRLDDKLYFIKSNTVKEFIIRGGDSQIIKRVKEKANVILGNNLTRSNGWRMDYSNVFEKYCQYIFQKAASEIGGSFDSNYKIAKSNYSNIQWELKYLEPDGLLRKDDQNIFIDCKYKSTMLNLNSKSESLKEDFRYDLHQILAYSSFSSSKNKASILCYPVTQDVKSFNSTYSNPSNSTNAKIYYLGVPMDTNQIDQVIDKIKEVVERTLTPHT